MKDKDILLGGRKIKVEKNDGTPIEITVKKLSHLGDLQGLIGTLHDDNETAKFYSGLSDEHLAEIPIEGIFEILEVGEELNSKAVEGAIKRIEKKINSPMYLAFRDFATTSNSEEPDTPKKS